MTCFMYFFTSSLFLTGQLSSFEMCAISFPLSLFSLLQSYSRCSTVRLPLAQGHSGDSIILNRCRYDLVFPGAVTIAIKLGVKLIFMFNLSLMFGRILFLRILQQCCSILVATFLCSSPYLDAVFHFLVFYCNTCHCFWRSPW